MWKRVRACRGRPGLLCSAAAGGKVREQKESGRQFLRLDGSAERKPAPRTLSRSADWYSGYSCLWKIPYPEAVGNQLPGTVGLSLPFVAGADTNYIPPQAGNGIYIGLQKRITAVRTVTVAETEIDGGRKLQLHRETDDIIQSLYQLGGSGKPRRVPDLPVLQQPEKPPGQFPSGSLRWPGRFLPQCQERLCRGRWCPCWEAVPGEFRGQRPVDFFLRIKRPQRIALRGRPGRNGLIPQAKNAVVPSGWRKSGWV